MEIKIIVPLVQNVQMTIKLNTDNFDKKVVDLILTKQADFKKEKRRMVSLDKTVERLLKEAYIKK